MGRYSLKWFILLAGIASNAGASILIKLAITPPRKFPNFSDLADAFSNWPFWQGLALYGIAFLLYAAALARLPLNVAHPVLTAGAIATVAMCSYLIFREPFQWTTVIGIFFVIVGVVLITLRVA